ncbi:hypothetical protein CEXT_780021 [Caerostris extrusa]|uniref:Uncharacterized protein n=1 Tax=Caerostris extrusa TaxID=172846 RepID=A0AAV4MTU7_CAEEX|nr:hypothetical protein CEXT_780021 [Caerostris extrusa]
MSSVTHTVSGSFPPCSCGSRDTQGEKNSSRKPDKEASPLMAILKLPILLATRISLEQVKEVDESCIRFCCPFPPDYYYNNYFEFPALFKDSLTTFTRPDGQLASALAFGASGSNPGGGLMFMVFLQDPTAGDPVDILRAKRAQEKSSFLTGRLMKDPHRSKVKNQPIFTKKSGWSKDVNAKSLTNGIVPDILGFESSHGITEDHENLQVVPQNN